MKAFSVACATAWFIACTSGVQAASSVDLSVTGAITPGACLPDLSEDGIVDFGKIPAKDLNVNLSTELPMVTLKLSVNCEGKTLFALNGRDNRRGSAHFSLSSNYGLGLINGDQKLGSYGIGVFNPVADTPVYPLFSSDHGKTWLVNSSGSYMGHDYWNGFGLEMDTPIALQNVTVDLRIRTYIAPARTLTLTEEVPLDGSATLDVVYL